MDKFAFAHRTNWQLKANSLNCALEELKSRNVPVLDLTASNPTDCGFAYPEDFLSALNVQENLHYQPDPCGLESAREAVASYYQRHHLPLSSREVVLTASTSEAYSFLMRLLVNPGEKVLIPKPSYPLFQFLLDINDVSYDYYPLIYDGNWRLDCRALETLVDGGTRAIIVVNPNNPTGSYISPADLNFLNELCCKHRMALIGDEVFFDYPLHKGNFVSLAGNHPVLTFVLGGLSKMLGLPQMKCSWILVSGPQETVKESLSRLEIIADTFLSVNTPAQNALRVWLPHAGDIHRQIGERVQDNWRWLNGHLGKHAQLLALQGGWYATLRIPAVKPEEEWVLEFLKEDHVLVYPGYFFDFEKEAYIILSLLPQAPVFQQAAGHIMKRLGKI